MYSCQCHQIGGPFIAEDPDCPEHGTEAQSRRDQQVVFAEKLRSIAENGSPFEIVSALYEAASYIEDL